MPTRIEIDELRELLESGVQLIDVLPQEEYAEEHLPGAIGIPLKKLDAATTKALAKERRTVVYCWDYL